MKFKKEITITLIYILINLSIYHFYGSFEVKNLINNINMFGIGFLLTAILIFSLEKLNKKMVEGNRLPKEYAIGESNFAKNLFFFGFASLLLYIANNI